MKRPRILFAASEAWPLVKTGGLGDVGNALPNALARRDADVRLVLPGYPAVTDQVRGARVVATLDTPSGRRARVIECHHRAFDCPLWRVDMPGFSDRPGNPYVDAAGGAWTDNAERFCDFSAVAAALAGGGAGGAWRADVLHCNDWQGGLAAAFAARRAPRPCTVFTIHNVAYDCLFDHDTFVRLSLPAEWWSIDGGEFYHRYSMLKSGIVFADALTTVSPRYAREICSEAFGFGYAGILNAHRGKLTGILNGIDDVVWDPARDVHLARCYGPEDDVVAAKTVNARALLEAVDAAPAMRGADTPLVGFVGRLVHQKGVDLLLGAIGALAARGRARFVVIGTGEAALQDGVRELARRLPGAVACHVGYDERLAHLLEAGCDLFAMPSRFEPCGLNQMYSMRYGTPPVVRETGGLADTVIDANTATLADGTATGFVFREATAAALAAALDRAVDTIRDDGARRRLIHAGMTRDFGWDASAAQYLALYRGCVSSGK